MRCRFTVLDQLDPVPFHLDRHPTVQQVDRDDNPAASVFRSYHDALHSGERSPSDADGLTSPETGPGYERDLGSHQGPEGADFALVHGDWGASSADDLRHPGSIQDSESVGQVESAEQITGEKGFLDCFVTVGPAVPDLAHGQEGFKTSEAEFLMGSSLRPGSDLDGEPG